jgi:hypothetical protein
MTNNKYMTKYQLEHLKKRVNAEIDPVIDEAKLMRKSVVAELTASAESKLAKKIKADIVIKELEEALQQLEIAQRKARTFFTTKVGKSLKDSVNYTFKENNYTFTSSHNKGIMPNDCREQLREWAETLAIKEAEKTPEGKKVKQLELYKQSAAIRAPLSSIKLYGSESIKDLSENPDRATPLAVNDWQAINNIFLKK